MNKKEQAAFEELHVRLALRFTEPLMPDVPPPPRRSDYKALTTGWWLNAYNSEVAMGCSSSGFHSLHSTTKTSTQQPMAFHSTRLRALKALRAEKEMEYAKRLRKLDLEIEKEEREPTSQPNTPAP